MPRGAITKRSAMVEARIRQLLSYLAVPESKIERHGDWYHAPCPLAFAKHSKGKDANPSFGIKENKTGDSIYNCFACNSKGALAGLLMELQSYQKHAGYPGHLELGKAWALIEEEQQAGYFPQPEWKEYPDEDKKEFTAWPDWWLDEFLEVEDVDVAVAYLVSRHVPPILHRHFDLKYDSERHMVGFPYRNRDGLLAGMRGRSLRKMTKKPHHDYSWDGNSNVTLVWLGEQKLDYNKPIIVTEGPFDYASVYRVYRNVVANLSASISYHKTRKLAQSPKVLSFLDTDMAGEQGHAAMEQILAKDTVLKRIKIPLTIRDEDGHHCKDPGKCTVEQLEEILMPFVDLDPIITMESQSV